MTGVSLVLGNCDQTAEADLARGRPQTLADEHVQLLWQVTARVQDLLTAAANGRWPGAELAGLADYAQAEVLRQASEEEALLFPAASAQQVSKPARDHVRLRSAADLLARSAEGELPLSPDQLAAVARNFVDQLERHMRSEENLLASGHRPWTVPGTAALSGHRHEWYPLTKGPVADLDTIRPCQAVSAAVGRLLRLRRGEQIELRASASLDPVWLEISRLSPGSYQFVSLQDGPARWRMRVTHRHAAA
jgi:uncharacterized protein (DUF2249 family)